MRVETACEVRRNPLSGAHFAPFLRAMRGRNGLPKFLGMATKKIKPDSKPGPARKRKAGQPTPPRSPSRPAPAGTQPDATGVVVPLGDGIADADDDGISAGVIAETSRGAAKANVDATQTSMARMSPTVPDAVKHGPEGPTTAPPKLLARLREALRVRHYSIRTEQAYVEWTRRFIHFHGLRHPASLGASEVQAFLTHLAVDRSVASSTQNQAKSALL